MPAGQPWKAISRLDDPRAVAILLPRLPHRSSYVTIEVSEDVESCGLHPGTLRVGSCKQHLDTARSLRGTGIDR